MEGFTEQVFSEAQSSAFSPSGPDAARIADLWWIMLIVFAGIFLLLMILTALALLKGRWQSEPRAPMGDKNFIVLGGIVMPAVVLVPLLAYTLMVTEKIGPRENPLVIEITGHMWWWHVQYPDDGIITANELHVPVGRPIHLKMTSADVIHSFWPPSLSGKTDLIPGQVTHHWMEAERSGLFRVQCAEFCGLQHARMALMIVALKPEDYEAWLRKKKETAPPPQNELHARGKQAFFQEGCAECHRIRGTEAQARIGPDLTHIGSRLSLGAGTIANSYGALAGWVANPQALKPGNRMPASYIAANDYHALVSYLMSLQ